MYNAADTADVPAPFDWDIEMLFPPEDGNAMDAILDAERGKSSAKASKRSLVVAGEGVCLGSMLCPYVTTFL